MVMNYSEGGAKALWLLLCREHAWLARQWRARKEKRGSVILARAVVTDQGVMGLS